MRGEKDMVQQMKIDDFQGGDTEKCRMCEEGEATRSYAVQEFEYGSGKDAVTLSAHVPVWSCVTCDLQYVDAEGERAQHEAVCRHLGRLTPSEIKVIRISAQLTQREFADKLQCGIASLKRWEAGALVQGRAADAAIREFQVSAKRANLPKPVFRTPISDAQRAAAKSFSLRGTRALQLAA
jgi:putative zinc finger/helix-turn-helix YgiT family protein